MKKWILISAGVIVGLVLISVMGFFSLPYILSAFDGKDDQLSNDKDLIPQKIDITRPGNAFQVLHSIKFPEKDEINIIPWFDGNGPTDKIDWQLAPQILDSSKIQLNSYNQASYSKYYQNPYLADPNKYDAFSDEALVAYNDIRKAGRIAALKSLYLHRNGQTDAAIEQALILYRNCSLMANSNSELIGYLVGLNQCKMSLDVLSHNDRISNLTETQKQYIKSVLNSKADTSKGLTTSIQFTYLIGKQSLAKIKSGGLQKFHEETVGSEIDMDVSKLLSYGDFDYYLKPNQTMNEYSEIMRRLLRFAKEPCDYKNTAKPYSTSFWKSYTTENSIGKMLNGVRKDLSESFFGKPCELQKQLNTYIKL